MKAVKRSIAVCVLALIMCVSLLVGVTFAWFTDSITNSGNIITAGSLSVNWKYRSAGSQESFVDVTEETALFSDSALWQPGGSQSYEFMVSNVGTLPLDWQLSLENVTVSVGADLTECLTITVGENVLRFENGTVINSGINLASNNSSAAFTVIVALDGNAAGDSYQNASVSFNFVLTANQTGATTGFSASVSSATTSVI